MFKKQKLIFLLAILVTLMVIGSIFIVKNPHLLKGDLTGWSLGGGFNSQNFIIPSEENNQIELADEGILVNDYDVNNFGSDGMVDYREEGTFRLADEPNLYDDPGAIGFDGLVGSSCWDSDGDSSLVSGYATSGSRMEYDSCKDLKVVNEWICDPSSGDLTKVSRKCSDLSDHHVCKNGECVEGCFDDSQCGYPNVCLNNQCTQPQPKCDKKCADAKYAQLESEIKQKVPHCTTANCLKNIIYVEVSGSDLSGNGTLSRPFRSLNRALDVALAKGDSVIYLGEGDFILNKFYQIEKKKIYIIGKSKDKTIVKAEFSKKTYPVSPDYLFLVLDSDFMMKDLTFSNNAYWHQSKFDHGYHAYFSSLFNVINSNVQFKNMPLDWIYSPYLFRLIGSYYHIDGVDYGNTWNTNGSDEAFSMSQSVGIIENSKTYLFAGRLTIDHIISIADGVHPLIASYARGRFTGQLNQNGWFIFSQPENKAIVRNNRFMTQTWNYGDGIRLESKKGDFFIYDNIFWKDSQWDKKKGRVPNSSLSGFVNLKLQSVKFNGLYDIRRNAFYNGHNGVFISGNPQNASPNQSFIFEDNLVTAAENGLALVEAGGFSTNAKGYVVGDFGGGYASNIGRNRIQSNNTDFYLDGLSYPFHAKNNYWDSDKLASLNIKKEGLLPINQNIPTFIEPMLSEASGICSDLDLGPNSRIASSTSNQLNKRSDTCQDGVYLKEFYCAWDGQIKEEVINCNDQGMFCDSGACSICVDPDGGKNYSLKTRLKVPRDVLGAKPIEDKCKSPTHLWENYCDGQAFKVDTFDCSSIGKKCIDGACI